MQLLEWAMASVIGVGSAMPFYKNPTIYGGGGGGGTTFRILLESGDALDAENGDNLRTE